MSSSDQSTLRASKWGLLSMEEISSDAKAIMGSVFAFGGRLTYYMDRRIPGKRMSEILVELVEAKALILDRSMFMRSEIRCYRVADRVDIMAYRDHAMRAIDEGSFPLIALDWPATT